MSESRHWRVERSRLVFSSLPRIQVWDETVRLPDGRLVGEFWKVALQDFVVIAAQDREGRFLFERQYKHGVGRVTLTLPAGGLEEGEAPLLAAQRELLEETGFEAANWRSLGDFVVGANAGIARAHLFLASDLDYVREPASGDLEEMDLLYLPRDEASQALAQGQIAVMSCALCLSLALSLPENDLRP
jgi:ADP-ribose pyrophosphatase